LKAKKSYGQHFLKEESIAKKIAESLQLLDSYTDIIEVGPGMGMLTKYLLELKNHKLTVIEADADMVDYLNKNYPTLKGNIIFEDFLKTDIVAKTEGRQFALIGNFPYNISSQILFKGLDNRAYVPEMAGMFQKEVAERIAAKPGNKEYGILSVLIQAYYDVEYLFTVKPGSFIPPPKVLSGVISLKRKSNFLELGCNEDLFKTIVKMSFNQRRKMLRNSLGSLLKKELSEFDSFFEKRPEQLSVADFVALTNKIEKLNGQSISQEKS
jgi:16S rRNA (adenine1518-N6/adenine1519-N6)-dimethyltransferase